VLTSCQHASPSSRLCLAQAKKNPAAYCRGVARAVRHPYRVGAMKLGKS
jgi:hypothetical protein